MEFFHCNLYLLAKMRAVSRIAKLLKPNVLSRSFVGARVGTSLINSVNLGKKSSASFTNRMFSSFPPTYNELSSLLSEQIIEEEGSTCFLIHHNLFFILSDGSQQILSKMCFDVA